MYRHKAAQVNKPVFGEEALHPIDVLVHPLHIPNHDHLGTCELQVTISRTARQLYRALPSIIPLIRRE